MKESPEHIDELIERYLQLQMDADEQKTFESMLATDADLRERLEHHSNLMEMLDQEEGVAKLSQDIYEIIDHQESKSTTRLYFQAAVFFLVAIGMVFMLKLFNTGKTSEELAVTYFEPFSDVVTNRAGIDSLVAIAMNAYNEKDYNLAIQQFNTLNKPPNTVYGLYLGISYFAVKDYENAMIVLSTLEQNAPSNLTHTSKWYVALTAFAMSQEEEGKSRLQELSKTNSAVSKKAADLLSEIN